MMKKRTMLICSIVVIALMALSVAPIFAGESAVDKDFCWRDSYGRGAGKVPGACAEGRDRIGLLCYTKCPDGMKRSGFDCYSVCPSGMRDDGLFCRAAEYGRGGGYPWKGKDGFSDKGMFRRCEADHGSGNCEKNGAIVYPKCRAGYHNVGCCICRPDTPNCEALGLGGRFDLSCAKKIKTGDPRVGVCPAGQERNAGLCYNNCKAGYKGVGPVCWGKSPADWVECGMGSARNKKICGATIFNQVSSVGMMAFDITSEILTFGASAGVIEGEKTAEGATKLKKLKQMYSDLKKIYDKAKPSLQEIVKTKKQAGVIVQLVDMPDDNIVTAEDIARIAFQISAITDPTGISDTVAAYMYPKCNKYFPDYPTTTPGACPPRTSPNHTPTDVGANASLAQPKGKSILNTNEKLVSKNGRFTLSMQSDCNLVLYDAKKGKGGSDPSAASWSSNTSVGGGASCKATFREDGSLAVINKDGKVVYQSGAASISAALQPAILILQEDGNLVAYQCDEPYWASNTSTP